MGHLFNTLLNKDVYKFLEATSITGRAWWLNSSVQEGVVSKQQHGSELPAPLKPQQNHTYIILNDESILTSEYLLLLALFSFAHFDVQNKLFF